MLLSINFFHFCSGEIFHYKNFSSYFENDVADVKNGVVTTIDINIQNAVETIIEQINSGCVIVSEVGNAKIRAMASVPTFDINNLEESLKKEDSPMINRAILPYNVGSVFKPCVAAASIENQKDNLTFVCEGRLEIAKRMFGCVGKIDGDVLKTGNILRAADTEI